MSVEIRPLSRAQLDPAFDLATEAFVSGSTLHQALGIGLSEYRTYLRPSFEAMVDEGLSVCAHRDGRMIGCLILTDFYPLLTVESGKKGQFAPLSALTSALRRQYPAHRLAGTGEVVLADMAAISPEAAGEGIYQRLRTDAHRTARRKGFTHVVGELSSDATRHVVLGKLGHKRICEVAFASFAFEGDYPFRSITEPESLILAEGDL